MSLTSESMTPADFAAITGGNRNDFGGDGWWIILFFILAMNGGWGGFGGFGGNGMGAIAADGAMLYPWMNQSQQVNNGFRDQMINQNISDIEDSVNSLATQVCNSTAGIQQSLCSGFAGVNATVNSGFANAETAANARQMANMQQAFNAQTAVTQGMNDIGMSLQNCCCENRANIADLKYTVATENCADRTAAAQNTRDIIDSQTRGTQAILDQLCALELDGIKGQLAQAQRDNVDLQNQLNMATIRESQANQNALFAQGLNNEVDALYNRLKNCPVGTTPVYGNQPIFTCGGNNGCGCGGNGFIN